MINKLILLNKAMLNYKNIVLGKANIDTNIKITVLKVSCTCVVILKIKRIK